jgi:hypothetical protein
LVKKVQEKLQYFARRPKLILGVMGKYRKDARTATA